MSGRNGQYAASVDRYACGENAYRRLIWTYLSNNCIIIIDIVGDSSIIPVCACGKSGKNPLVCIRVVVMHHRPGIALEVRAFLFIFLVLAASWVYAMICWHVPWMTW